MVPARASACCTTASASSRPSPNSTRPTGAEAQKFLDNELVRQPTAWKKKQVVYLNAMNWYTLGSASIGALQENVDQLSAAPTAAQAGR